MRAYLVTAYAAGEPRATVRECGLRRARKLAQWFSRAGYAVRICRDRPTRRVP